MKILILGINYDPEPTGIAVYTSGLARGLHAHGHQIRVVTGQPYYPDWKISKAHKTLAFRNDNDGGVSIVRCPLYVPANPTAIKRIAHHISFAASATMPMLYKAIAFKPDVVLTVAPSMVAAPVAKFAALLCGAKTWLHIQDFEVEAGFATGHINKRSIVARLGLAFEKFILSSFDMVSTISYEMCNKLLEKGRSRSDIFELRNWADINAIYPKKTSTFREKWNVKTPYVALYSGSIAQKQGIEIIVDAARILKDRNDITFIICGNGPDRSKLEEYAMDLPNLQVADLQPYNELNELLALATVHLLPQKAGAADLVLPSKLTNILASGRPVIACAAIGTGLAREVESCGNVVEPENPLLLAEAIVEILDDKERYRTMSTNARNRATKDWDQEIIIRSFEKKLSEIVE